MRLVERVMGVALAVGAGLAMTGCVSISTMQTAQTLPPGEGLRTIGAGYFYYDPSVLFGSEEDDEAWLPYMEFGLRQGLSDRVDWGGRISIFGTVVSDVKYQFADGDRFDAAVGGGVGFLLFSSTEGGDRDSATFVDLILPLYLSWEVSPRFTPYVSPKFVWRSRSADDGRAQSILGATVGARIGDRRGVFVELGGQDDLRSDFSAVQFNVGWFWTR